MHTALRPQDLILASFPRFTGLSLTPSFRQDFFPAQHLVILRFYSGIWAAADGTRADLLRHKVHTKRQKCGPKGKEKGIRCNISGMLRLNNGIFTATVAPTETKTAFTRVLVAQKDLQILQHIDYSGIFKCSAKSKQLLENTGFCATLRITSPENEVFAIGFSNMSDNLLCINPTPDYLKNHGNCVTFC